MYDDIYRSMLSSSSSGFAIADLSGSILWKNHAFSKLTKVDFKTGDSPKLRISDIFIEEEHAVIESLIQLAIENGSSFDLLRDVKRGASGKKFPARLVFTRHTYLNNDFLCLELVDVSNEFSKRRLKGENRDLQSEIAQRKAAEAQLHVNFQFIKDVFDSLRDGVCAVHGADHTIDWANPAFLRMFFADEAHSLMEESLDSLLNRFGVKIDFVDMEAKSSDFLGIEIEIGAGANARSYLVRSWKTTLKNRSVLLVSFSDVTEMFRIKKEKQEIEMQLMHAARLSSLGTMGAGLAHELNNPLASVIGFTSILQRNDLSRSRQLEILEKIQLNSNRMRLVINHMRSFARDSRNTERALCPIDIPIQNAFMILETQLELNSIETEIDHAHQLLSFLGDATEIESVLQNLISNSIDAFLTLEANSDDFRRKISLQILEKQKHILITYKDNAGGIPESIRAKIFEPFFTTKDVGKGTGIGLSISYRIIQNHGGTITVDCPSQGHTEFSVVLPLAATANRTSKEESEDAKQSFEAQTRTSAAHSTPITLEEGLECELGRRARIAWIDDEPNILELVEEMLGNSFDTMTYSDPEVAVKEILNNPPDLVITDMRMPKISGMQVITQIRMQHKSLPILVASGHAQNDQDALKIFAAGAQALLSKPLPSEESLCETIASFMSTQTKVVVFLVGITRETLSLLLEHLSDDCIFRSFETLEDSIPRLAIEYPQNIICALSIGEKLLQPIRRIHETTLPATQLIGIGPKNILQSELLNFRRLGFQVFSEENKNLIQEIRNIILRNHQVPEKPKKSA